MSPTPEQLLVLNTLLYLAPTTMKDYPSVGAWAQHMLDSPLELSTYFHGGDVRSGTTYQEYQAVLRKAASDPAYRSITVKDVTTVAANPADPNSHDKSVMATFDQNGQPIIVYKGTSGALEWRDNGLGGAYNVTDTYRQQQALNYLNAQLAKYPPGTQVVVSGHSKGGNLAQYVTIVAGDKVVACYSFDGQGFNRAFMAKYLDEIAANGGKITSVANPSEPVNLLFFPIPGSKRLYTGDGGIHLATFWLDPGNPFKRLHSPFTIFQNKDGTISLVLTDASNNPNSPVAVAGDLMRYLQTFMDPKDFRDLCNLIMSGLMGGGPAYGSAGRLPPELLRKLMALLKNYAHSHGINPLKMDAAMAVLFPPERFPKLTVKWLLTPRGPFCTIPRDFTAATFDLMMSLVEEVKPKGLLDSIGDYFGDAPDRVKHAAGFGEIADDSVERVAYYKEMMDMSDMSAEAIMKIWQKVQALDREYSWTITAAADQADLFDARMLTVVGNIRTA